MIISPIPTMTRTPPGEGEACLMTVLIQLRMDSISFFLPSDSFDILMEPVYNVFYEVIAGDTRELLRLCVIQIRGFLLSARY